MIEFDKPTCGRFIAYFDWMGFKDFVYRHSHDEVKEKMDIVCSVTKAIESVERDTLTGKANKADNSFSAAVVLPVVFSDSIIFISNANTIDDAEKIIFVAQYFLSKLLINSIPVKGALAHGIFTADFKKSSFFGRPLIDAFLLAEEAHFYGAVLHNTFETYWKSIDKLKRMDSVKSKPVPMKGGYITHSYIDINNKIFFEGGNIEVVIEKFYESASGNTRLYVDNTKKVYSTTLGDSSERMGLLGNKLGNK